jgi:ABC-type multidrug transport system ATPase subunit
LPDAVHASLLEFRYGDRLALAGVSFSVAPASIFALLGPNGGGKTTLFRILATLARPHAGTFTVAGETNARAVAGVVPVAELDKLRARTCSGGALFGASLRKGPKSSSHPSRGRPLR